MNRDPVASVPPFDAALNMDFHGLRLSADIVDQGIEDKWPGYALGALCQYIETVATCRVITGDGNAV